ncbi:super-infection exclusion protein B [Marinovum sp.]|uniref:super-infection exclusion protein B n=1 Tax=Marinovum sp. TaxID=2024839 RepID=UPI003A93479A
MSEFLSKIWNLFETVVRPWHLLFVVAFVSGVLLFNPFQLNENFEIAEEVAEVKLWIFLVFFVSVGLIILKALSIGLLFIKGHAYKIFDNLIANSIELAPASRAILKFMLTQQPDMVPLNRKHPAVRELRLRKLVSPNPYLIISGDFDDYKLTPRGVSVARRAKIAEFEGQSEAEKIAFLDSVTGMKFRSVNRHSWML